MLKRLLPALAVALVGVSGASFAAGDAVKEYKHGHWNWQGINGRYDVAAMQRGYQVYREVCSSCHSMKLVAFRHLGDPGAPFHLDECPAELGLPDTVNCSDPAANPIIKSLAADFTITDGPDEAGDMFDRPGLPSDYLPSPYANDAQATAANGGAYPPDMSLLAKARHHGPDYIYSLLTGYPEEAPAALNVSPGQYYNPYYPGDTASLLRPEFIDDEGHVLEDLVKEATDEELYAGHGVIYGGAFKMAPPLVDGIVAYEDGSAETVDQYAKDVVEFLMWAAEPKLNERKQTGGFVMAYLFIFAGVVYASYRQVWSNVGH
ncbi:MAG: cytochrome c1 [Pseudomonadota bacterium]